MLSRFNAFTLSSPPPDKSAVFHFLQIPRTTEKNCLEKDCTVKMMETMLVCPMGGGATRLYSALTQTLDRWSVAHLDAPRPGSPPPEPADPLELLRECEEALRNRPPRTPRTFICTPGQGLSSAPNGYIRVMQWNILAQALAEGVDSFIRCPPDALNWAERKYLILEEILTYRPHILCLQEVDHYHDTFQPILARLGYRGIFCPKPRSPCLGVEGNNGPDGCALFFDQSSFLLLDTVNIRLSAMLIPTNQVAVVTMLRCRATGRRLCVTVTHLKARSGWELFRSAQGSDLLRHLQSIAAGPQHHRGAAADTAEPAPGTSGGGGGGADDAPLLLVCGDFNAAPTEEVYRRFAASPLGLDSAYKRLSRGGASEPAYTSWKVRPSGECCSTLDYVWYSRDGLSVEAVLDMPTEEQIGPDRLPSYNYPSDHLSLVCDFSFSDRGE